MDFDVSGHASNTDSKADGFGGYLVYEHKRVYASGIIRWSGEKHTAATPGTGSVDTKARAIATSIEVGCKILCRSPWKAEIYGQYVSQKHTINDCVDPDARLYRFETVNSAVLRAGVRLWRDFELRPGMIFHPYVRGGYASELDGGVEMTVIKLGYGMHPQKYHDEMDGGGAIIDAGASLVFGGRFLVTAGGAWYSAGKVESYNINLGAGVSW
jgi:outer membrane autotransporter protein